MKDDDKKFLNEFIPKIDLNFELIATTGTYKYIKDLGFSVSEINKVQEGRPHIVDETCE